MREYIDRLMRCGFSADRAYSICQDFGKNLPLIELENFIQSIERDCYVDRILEQPNR